MAHTHNHQQQERHVFPHPTRATVSRDCKLTERKPNIFINSDSRLSKRERVLDDEFLEVQKDNECLDYETEGCLGFLPS
jgi:hypothetical protein